MLCDRPTGPFLAALGTDGRHRWTGPDGRPQVRCGYEARDADAMLCHLLATHELTLDKARRTVAQRIVGGKPSN
jgi:hypothetical protein